MHDGLSDRGNTGYTPDVAKVMISLPDPLLASIGAEAQRRGTSRSAVIRACAEAEFARRNEQLAARMRELDALPTLRLGGDGTALIRAARDAR